MEDLQGFDICDEFYQNKISIVCEPKIAAVIAKGKNLK
jgi:hypothetical protein